MARDEAAQYVFGEMLDVVDSAARARQALGLPVPQNGHGPRDVRAIGEHLLDLSAGYEDFRPHDRTQAAIAGLVGRGRRLLSAAYLLADADKGLEAAVLLRSLTEYAFTLLWLNKDIELNVLRLLSDGIEGVLAQDAELRKLERRRRRELGMPPPTAEDEPLGLLDPAMRERFLRARDEVRAEIGGTDRLDERLERPRRNDERPARVRARKLPSLRQRAIIGGLGYHYALAYTFDSQAAAHPTSMAAEQLLSLAGAIPVVNAAPARPLPDPYAVGAALLGILIDAGGEVLPDLAVDDVHAIVRELADLRPFA